MFNPLGIREELQDEQEDIVHLQVGSSGSTSSRGTSCNASPSPRGPTKAGHQRMRNDNDYSKARSVPSDLARIDLRVTLRDPYSDRLVPYHKVILVSSLIRIYIEC